MNIIPVQDLGGSRLKVVGFHARPLSSHLGLSFVCTSSTYMAYRTALSMIKASVAGP